MKKSILVVCSVFLFLQCGISYFSSISPWDNGIITYRYVTPIMDHHKKIIRSAMDEWEDIGNVKFLHKPKKGLYKINFTVDKRTYRKCEDGTTQELTSASSTVGFVGIYSQLNLTNDVSKSTILHELGHCLGLQHEHQRPDRDKYIEMLWDNMDEKDMIGVSNNMNALSRDKFLYPPEKFPYDYKSIMHYPETTFSKECNLITIKAPVKIRDDVISEIDKKKIRYIYGSK